MLRDRFDEPQEFRMIEADGKVLGTLTAKTLQGAKNKAFRAHAKTGGILQIRDGNGWLSVTEFMPPVFSGDYDGEMSLPTEEPERC